MVKNIGSGIGLLGFSSQLHRSPHKVCDFRQVTYNRSSCITELLRGLNETIHAKCLALHLVHSRCFKMWEEHDDETLTLMMMIVPEQHEVLLLSLCVLCKRRWQLYCHEIQINSEVNFYFLKNFCCQDYCWGATSFLRSCYVFLT